jgi:hypothetical protein
MGQKIVVTTTLVFRVEANYPEAYPDMTLEEAIAYEEDTPWVKGTSYDEVLENATIVKNEVHAWPKDV